MSSKKQDKLNSFYTSILKTLDISVDENGLLSSTYGPLMLDDKRLALPVDAALGNIGKGELIAFHPLSENLYNGISPVLSAVRHIMMQKLSDIITTTMYCLLTLSSDGNMHAKLTEKQLAKLSEVSGVDSKLLETFKKLVNDVISVDSDKRIVNIVLRQGQSLDEKKYLRTAHISFPFLQELNTSEDGTIFGVKFRKKDLPILRNAFTLVLPEADKEDKYSEGSNADVAPYFMALLKTYISTISGTASITSEFKQQITELQADQTVDISDLLDVLSQGEDNLAGLAKAVAPMLYNMGETDMSNDTETPQEAASRIVRETIGEEVPVNTRLNTSSRRTSFTSNREVVNSRQLANIADTLPRTTGSVTNTTTNRREVVERPRRDVVATRQPRQSVVPQQSYRRQESQTVVDRVLHRTSRRRHHNVRDIGRGYDNDTIPRGSSFIDSLPRR